MTLKKSLFFLSFFAALLIHLIYPHTTLRSTSVFAAPLSKLSRGVINETEVNLRSDSTIHSFIIGKASKGQELKIIGSRYSWYKVVLPSDFVYYIHADYLNTVGDNKVKVVAKNVNLRMRPSLSAPIVGVAGKGEVLAKKSRSNGWVKVSGSDSAYGWVHEKFIDAIKLEPKTTKKTVALNRREQKKKLNTSDSDKNEGFVYRGYLKKISNIKGCPVNYKIINGLLVFFLKITDTNKLDNLVGKEVVVKGDKVNTEGCSYIKVNNIRLLDEGVIKK